MAASKVQAIAPESWRENVLRGMLTVAAVVAPLLASLALFVGSSPRYPIDVIVLASSGLLLPLLRFARGLSVARRALTVIAILFVVGVYLLARAGFAAGVTVLLVTTCVLGVIYLGRGFGFVLIGLSAAAHVTVGLLVTRGTVLLDPVEVDPLRLQNWLRMAASTSLLAALLVTVIDFVIRHVEANARTATEALAQLRLSYERLGQLHARLEAAKEEERRFLAHELHDELGQSLTALKLRFQMSERVEAGLLAPSHPDRQALALIDHLIARVRKMSGDLRPPLLDEVGLFPALHAYVESQAALSGVAIQLEVDGACAGERLAPELEIVCFRVAQESITNALRHAAAGRVHVRIVRDGGRVCLGVRDDGRGFDATSVDASAAAGHLGVVGMRERVRALAGSFRLSSQPGGGTTVEIELPVDRNSGSSASL